MSKNVIYTPDAPAPIGPYSQAVQAGNTLFISGQISINPETGVFVAGPLEEQAQMAMENLQTILEAAGASMAKVIKTTIFLAPGEDFDVVNKVYGAFFTNEFPARETVWVHTLPKGARVEISMVAWLG